MGVLGLAEAFDKFDTDHSAGLSVPELKDALTHLGIPTTSKQAEAILSQHDRYPDLVIDVKEFTGIVRDVQLLLSFDVNDDGELDADELLPCLRSLGLSVDKEQARPSRTA